MTGNNSMIFLAIAAGAAACNMGIQNKTDALPNVVIIFSDDQGYGDVSFNRHHAPIHTPNIDRIAQEGITFIQGYVSAPTCSPSRASLMTGLYPQRMGIYSVDNPFQTLSLDVKIAPEYFREQGYATGLIGKWHLGGEFFPDKFPVARGFDRFYGWLDSTHDYWKANTGRSHTHGPAGYAPLFDQMEPVDHINAYLTREITEKSLAFIDQHKDTPFFLYVAHHCSHVPLQVPRETYDRYSPLAMGENTITTRAMYDELDASVGAILDRLEKYGIRDNTIVVFQSDNGGGEPEAQLNWIYRGGKFTLLEGGLRVPTAISWPARLPENKIYGHPVMNIDFLPTLLSAAGIPCNADMDGVDLIPYLTGKEKGRPHEMLFWNVGDQYAIRDGDWKLVETANGRGLFDLATDPEELYDLSTAHPERIASMLLYYSEWNSKNTTVRPTREERHLVDSIIEHADPRNRNWSYSSKFGD